MQLLAQYGSDGALTVVLSFDELSFTLKFVPFALKMASLRQLMRLILLDETLPELANVST